jgi:hypothetical protein
MLDDVELLHGWEHGSLLVRSANSVHIVVPQGNDHTIDHG